MDSPVKNLGVQHRQVNHTYSMVETIRKKYGEKGAKISLLHLLLDMNILDSDFIEKQVKNMKEYLTIKEVSERLSISEQTVRIWIKDGKLPAVKVGRRYRVTIADCDTILY